MKSQIQNIGRKPRIAIMLPCLNEEATLAKVIRDFGRLYPETDIYVFDNGSTDKSAEIAKREGAILVPVPRKGKGNVVRRMFELVEADVYVMVDSDDTYDPTCLPKLVDPLLSGHADMVVATRLEDHTKDAFRRLHRFGNRFFLILINTVFGSHLTDIFSGYRSMSRYLVKNIPLFRDGFEIETELTIYSLINGFTIQEIRAPYKERPANSHSKLKTFSDGYKILLSVVWLLRDLRPLVFFGGLATTFLCLSLISTSNFQSLFLTIIAAGFGTIGLTLNTMNVKFAELQMIQRRHSGNQSEVERVSEKFAA